MRKITVLLFLLTFGIITAHSQDTGGVKLGWSFEKGSEFKYRMNIRYVLDGGDKIDFNDKEAQFQKIDVTFSINVDDVDANGTAVVLMKYDSLLINGEKNTDLPIEVFKNKNFWLKVTKLGKVVEYKSPEGFEESILGMIGFDSAEPFSPFDIISYPDRLLYKGDTWMQPGFFGQSIGNGVKTVCQIEDFEEFRSKNCAKISIRSKFSKKNIKTKKISGLDMDGSGDGTFYVNVETGTINKLDAKLKIITGIEMPSFGEDKKTEKITTNSAVKITLELVK